MYLAHHELESNFIIVIVNAVLLLLLSLSLSLFLVIVIVIVIVIIIVIVFIVTLTRHILDKTEMFVAVGMDTNAPCGNAQPPCHHD